MLPKSVLIILGSALLVIIGILALSVSGHAEILLPALKADNTPHITVDDQFVKSWDFLVGTVIIPEVVSDRAAWIVIHADENGEPGDAIGRAKIPAGKSTDVYVDLDARSATLNLYAMLHVDEGKPGKFEYPGADVPLTVDGHEIVQQFEQCLK